MIRSARPTIRRIVAALSLAMLFAPPAAAQQAPEFGGFSAAVETVPLSVKIYEPGVQLAITETLAEGQLGLTRTSLSTGPNGKALASPAWPGDFVAGAPGLVAEQAPAYPGGAAAQFPQGPTEHTAGAPGAAGGSAVAKDYLAAAEARVGPQAGDGQIDVAAASGIARSAIEEGKVIARGSAVMAGVSLLAGVITVDEIRTTGDASSDGSNAVSTGSSVVSGLTIGGQGYIVDAQGLRPVEGDAAAGMPEGPEGLAQLGITVEPLPARELHEGGHAERELQALKLTVDSVLLRQAFQELPLADAIGATPGEVAARLYPVLNLGPRIVFELGIVRVRAIATAPYEDDALFSGGSTGAGDDAFAGGSADFGGGTTFAGFDSGTVGGTSALSGTLAPLTSSPGRAFAPPLSATGTTTLPDPFRGIPGALIAAALLLSLSLARRLRGLSAMVLAPRAVQAGCERGAAGAIPDLRATRS